MEVPRYSDLMAQAEGQIAGENIKNCNSVNNALALIQQAFTKSIGRPSTGVGVREVADILTRHQRFCADPFSHRSFTEKSE